MNSIQIRQIGIVGAGIMGHSIAQICAQAGYQVVLTDISKAVLSDAAGKIEKNLKELLSLHFIEQPEIDQCLDRISLREGMGTEISSCQVVIESVSEDLGVKKAVFAKLEQLCLPETIFCSNTSCIPIEKICSELQHKHRVLGTHFWNPPNIMPCVEVIKSRHTDDQVFETIVSLMEQIGKKPVRVFRDVPGFLGNRLQLALLREALFIVEEGIATPEDIDQVVKTGFGMRLPFAGLFELMDLTGHDTAIRVQDYLFPELACGKSAPELLKQMVARGDLGVKSGKGFYDWPDDMTAQRMQYRNNGLLGLMQLLKSLGEKPAISL